MGTRHKTAKTFRKRQLNMQLSILNAFTPLNTYEIYHIHKSTSVNLLHDLIKYARKTTEFTADTERDYYTHQPALIQIEFIQRQRHSIVLLIEVFHLPHESSTLFWLIKSLLKVIFHSSNRIFSWGDLHDELIYFIQYGIISREILTQMNSIDIQKCFKRWHNSLLEHECHYSSINKSNTVCTYSHKSITDIHHKWSLQMAIAYVFNEFLDKSQTKNRWSQQLDLNQQKPSFCIINEQNKKTTEQMILYAVNDCLAVTKLVMLLKLDSTR